jgi:flagellar biosynthetic protein FlhB
MATYAGDRTEKPTARRLKDSREKGDVARSRDLSSALSLAAVTLSLGWFGAGLCAAVSGRLVAALRGLGDHPLVALDSTGLSTMVWDDLWRFGAVAGPLLGIASVVSIGASVAQVGWMVAPKALEFNWERLSPSSGLSRLLPRQALPELLKALIGLTALGAVCYAVVHEAFGRVPYLVAMTPASAIRAGWDEMSRLLWRASLALLVLGGADYGVQRWHWYSKIKMTRQEVRDDSKQQEGSPQIKARVRKVQREMTRRRMLQAVKNATVVITNPTHFAVAVEYRRRDMVAPVVVAKGQDLIAARIRKVARDHGVPIVENVTLARALYAGAEIGDTIPAALFGAVAEVLAYLVRLKQLIL